MVYGVFCGYYSDWEILGYFNNQEDAEKYSCVCGKEHCYVEPIKDLTNKMDLSQVKLKYAHEVVFDYKDDEWVMRDEPDRYEYYVDSKSHCNKIYTLAVDKSWINFTVNIEHNDRKLAEKIAQDYLAELRSYGDGNVYDRDIKMMNARFLAGKGE